MPSLSVITPSWNSLSHLALCARSVADQLPGAAVEHLIIDGGSTDGTPAWLANNRPAGSWISEPDQGMYDAINKGLSRASGDIISYLNCDEQYLPGTLAKVSTFFEHNPECDILFGDALLIHPDGSYLASRRGYPPRRAFLAVSHLYVLSCTMFFRRSILEKGFQFSTGWKTIGDYDFVMRILGAGFQARHVPGFLSAFTITGNNLGGGELARREIREFQRAMPAWMRILGIPINGLRLLSKAMHGAYRPDKGLMYRVFTNAQDSRQEFCVDKSTWRWPSNRRA